VHVTIYEPWEDEPVRTVNRDSPWRDSQRRADSGDAAIAQQDIGSGAKASRIRIPGTAAGKKEIR
jgi:hypothetical protein